MASSADIEGLSRAVSLTVLEIDFDPHRLIPAFLIANLMSPALWEWRKKESPFSSSGKLLSTKSRLRQLQRFFHHYEFLNLQDRHGGDPWGLMAFAEEEKRFGSDFVNRIRSEYDHTLNTLLDQNPDSQFGRIVTQDYYRRGLFPRLKNEQVELMDAISSFGAGKKPAGKCIGLGILWAAALVVWGRFLLEKIYIIGNRAHLFVFLDVDGGHLFNNTRWFSRTRINNDSELSSFVREVTSEPRTSFFYNPALGTCHCHSQTSQIPIEMLSKIYERFSSFVSSPLKHPNIDEIRMVHSGNQLPNPLEFESAELFRAHIGRLASSLPGSEFDLALYSFRSLRVRHPQAYVAAASRDFHVRRLAENVTSLPEALEVVKSVAGRRPIWGSRERNAMPDEILFFGSGSDRDKALLLFTLLQISLIADDRSVIAITDDNSYVSHKGLWVDVSTLSTSTAEPREPSLIFNANHVLFRDYRW